MQGYVEISDDNISSNQVCQLRAVQNDEAIHVQGSLAQTVWKDEGMLDKCPVIAVLSVKALTREDLLLSSGNREAKYFFSTLSFLPRVSELF